MTPKGKLSLLGILALLRAQHWNYWTSHWQVSGNSFYGDHLLFGRVYDAIEKEIDVLAEKIVAMCGIDAVDPVGQSQLMRLWLNRWKKIPDLYQRALSSERDMQQAFKACYEDLKESGGMTLGLDDFIMATASAHETFLYLIQQRVRNSAEADLRVQWYGLAKKGSSGFDLKKKFIEEEGDKKIKSPDTGNDVKVKTLPNRPKGKKLFDQIFEKWRESQSKDSGEDSAGKETDEILDSLIADLEKDQSEVEGMFEKVKKWDSIIPDSAEGFQAHSKEAYEVLRDLDIKAESRGLASRDDVRAKRDLAKEFGDSLSQNMDAEVDNIEREFQELKDGIALEGTVSKVREELEGKSQEAKEKKKNLNESKGQNKEVKDKTKAPVKKIKEDSEPGKEKQESVSPEEIKKALEKAFESLGASSQNNYKKALSKSLTDKAKKGLGGAFGLVKGLVSGTLGAVKGTSKALVNVLDYTASTSISQALGDVISLMFGGKDEVQKRLQNRGLVDDPPAKDSVEGIRQAGEAIKKALKESGIPIPEDMIDQYAGAAMKQALIKSNPQIAKMIEEQEAGNNKQDNTDKETKPSEKTGPTEREKLESELEDLKAEKSDYQAAIRKNKKKEETKRIKNKIEKFEDKVEDLDFKIRKVKRDLKKITKQASGEEDFVGLFIEELSNPSEETLSAIAKTAAYGSAAKYFFNGPEQREVLQFALSGQKSNLTAEEQAKGAPPTPVDIKKGPGGKPFSTLNRYVVTTEHKFASGDLRDVWTFSNDGESK